jgi:hypothetical protein
MPRGQKSCIICDRGAADIVDRMLNANHKMRDISAALGNTISKSSIHKHSQTCWLKSRAATIRSKHKAPGRLFTQWPGQELPVPDGGWQPGDAVLVVSYEPLPEKPRNPNYLDPSMTVSDNLRDSLKPIEIPDVDSDEIA